MQNHTNNFITKRKLAQVFSALDESTHATQHKRPLTHRSVVQFGASVSSPLSPVTKTIGSQEDEGILGPYRPWSRADLLKRLASYKISFLVCARHGWINEKADLLACPTCHARLIVDLSSVVADTPEFICPWHERPCDESIYRFPMQSRTVNETALKDRIAGIIRWKNQLPIVIETSLASFMPTLLEWAASLPVMASLDTVYQSNIIALAIYGWREDSNCTTPVVQCDLCYQRVDFTLYTPLTNTTPEQEQNSNTATSNSNQHQYHHESIIETESLPCDPALEHRWYCPWIRKQVNNRGISTGTSTPLAGWEYIVHDICTLASRNHTASSTSQNTSVVVSIIAYMVLVVLHTITH
ncbi:hypothetical protein BDF22DRAFT_745996 [Syncephalis plumigaleata]|nr:hypothetical protein BDF22DRAFT_745996 [Syncephalis plumigaleata]